MSHIIHWQLQSVFRLSTSSKTEFENLSKREAKNTEDCLVLDLTRPSMSFGGNGHDTIYNMKIQFDEVPEVSRYTFILKLNEDLEHRLHTHQLFQKSDIRRLCEIVLWGIQDHDQLRTPRIPSQICHSIFEEIRDDPCLKILAEKLDLSYYHHLEPLIGTKIKHNTLTVTFSLHG